MTIVPSQPLKIVVTIGMPGLTIAQNVYYALYTGGADAADTDVVDDMVIWITALYINIDGQMNDTVTVDEVEVFKRVTSDPLVFESIGSDVTSVVGLVAGEALPNGVALVLRASTIALKSIARKYLPGISESNVLETTWSSTLLANAVLFLADWVAGPPTQGVRTYDGGIVSTKDGNFKAFALSSVVSAIPGYQRRRKPGVGI